MGRAARPGDGRRPRHALEPRHQRPAVSKGQATPIGAAHGPQPAIALIQRRLRHPAQRRRRQGVLIGAEPPQPAARLSPLRRGRQHDLRHRLGRRGLHPQRRPEVSPGEAGPPGREDRPQRGQEGPGHPLDVDQRRRRPRRPGLVSQPRQRPQPGQALRAHPHGVARGPADQRGDRRRWPRHLRDGGEADRLRPPPRPEPRQGFGAWGGLVDHPATAQREIAERPRQRPRGQDDLRRAGLAHEGQPAQIRLKRLRHHRPAPRGQPGRGREQGQEGQPLLYGAAPSQGGEGPPGVGEGGAVRRVLWIQPLPIHGDLKAAVDHEPPARPGGGGQEAEDGGIVRGQRGGPPSLVKRRRGQGASWPRGHPPRLPPRSGGACGLQRHPARGDLHPPHLGPSPLGVDPLEPLDLPQRQEGARGQRLHPPPHGLQAHHRILRAPERQDQPGPRRRRRRVGHGPRDGDIRDLKGVHVGVQPRPLADGVDRLEAHPEHADLLGPLGGLADGEHPHHVPGIKRRPVVADVELHAPPRHPPRARPGVLGVLEQLHQAVPRIGVDLLGEQRLRPGLGGGPRPGGQGAQDLGGQGLAAGLKGRRLRRVGRRQGRHLRPWQDHQRGVWDLPLGEQGGLDVRPRLGLEIRPGRRIYPRQPPGHDGEG